MTAPEFPPAATPSTPPTAAGGAPRVLGLDISMSATGVSCPACGLTTITSAPHPEYRTVERLRDIRDEIGAHLLHIDHEIALVVVEGLAISRQTGQHLTRAGLWHLVIDHIDGLAPWAEVPPTTLKRYATGKGVATKPDMRMALYKRTGLDEGDDNRVDAFWLAAMGADHLGHPIVSVPETHRAALTKVAWPVVTEVA